MFPVFVGIGALLGAAVITSTDVSYVRLQPSTSSIEAGEQFYIDVFAYAHVPVNAVDITLRFEPAAVEILGVDTGQSVLTIWTEEPVVESDRVVLRGGTFRNGFLKEHRIATINLKGVKTGMSTFVASDVVLLAGDGAGTQVDTTSSPASVSLYVYDKDSDPSEIGIDVQVNIITDIDGDGKVSLKDISVFMSAWTSKSEVFDFNGDGRMTFRDFSIILADFFLK